VGRILSTYIFPHPPIIVPEVGRGSEKDAQQTIDSIKKAAQKIKSENPDTIIVITPHGPVIGDYVYLSRAQYLKGNFGKFQAPRVKLEFQNNLPLVDKIIENIEINNISWQDQKGSVFKRLRRTDDLDHGALVPLYFISEELKDFKLIHIAPAWIPFRNLYKFGHCIGNAIKESNERVVVIASADLSHRLNSETAYGFSKDGKIFDELLVNSVSTSDVKTLLELDEDFCESAGECGLRSILVMLGAIDGMSIKPEIYSYEGPYGIGYAVARISVGEEDKSREILKDLEQEESERIKSLRANESQYVSLARNTLEAHVKDQEMVKDFDDLPEKMLHRKAGVFVSIKKDGQLRGCIGTIAPNRKNVAEEIMHNAISCGTQDPRFLPVAMDELDSLIYSVDVLGDPEPIDSMDELDVKRYGVIVREGFRSGLLLPDLEGIDTPREQVSIALRKAGISPAADYKLERFEVVRYT